jgi:hypothetical protein
MMEAIFWFGCGLIVGWNLLPQPAWVKMIYDMVVAKIMSMLGK